MRESVTRHHRIAMAKAPITESTKTRVIKEAERAGFVLVNQYDFVKPDNVDYSLVFRSAP